MSASLVADIEDLTCQYSCYSKTCLKLSLKEKTKIGSQD